MLLFDLFILLLPLVDATRPADDQMAGRPSICFFAQSRYLLHEQCFEEAFLLRRRRRRRRRGRRCPRGAVPPACRHRLIASVAHAHLAFDFMAGQGHLLVGTTATDADTASTTVVAAVEEVKVRRAQLASRKRVVEDDDIGLVVVFVLLVQTGLARLSPSEVLWRE
jgi:hypothetical protein